MEIIECITGESIEINLKAEIDDVISYLTEVKIMGYTKILGVGEGYDNIKQRQYMIFRIEK